MLRIICSEAERTRLINDIVDGYGPAFRAWLDGNSTRIRVLKDGERYADASPNMRRGYPVDSWPCPPAGLFVVSEATVYLRATSRMTIAHELMHAYDLARGPGRYLSSVEPTVRRCFAQAACFVTPYAASGIDEYFAECGRCLHPNGDDSSSPWPRATAKRLRRADPVMFEYLTALFAESPALAQAA